MTIVRRTLLLAAISLTGIGVLAPLAARSAVETPHVELDDRLLAEAPAPVMELNRGTLTARTAFEPASAPAGAAESFTDAALPTPASAPMEATLHVIPTPTRAPAPTAAPRPAAAYDANTVWDALAQCESGGNWAINTGNGYYGGLQFSEGTWLGYGGGEFAPYAHLATREQQIIVAERLHAARGFQPWPACRLKLGLP
jgi:hypothetical protein